MTDRDEDLKTRGWSRKNVASEPRLGEAVALYEELGFEVRLESLDQQDLDESCSVCFQEEPSLYKVIYTRKKTS